MELTEEQLNKAHDWLAKNGPEEGLCNYCCIGCDNPGVSGGPDGPIFPPCSDWMGEEDYAKYIDFESLVGDLE